MLYIGNNLQFTLDKTLCVKCDQATSMAVDEPKRVRWQSIAEDWLMAKLIANSGGAEIIAWDTERLAELAEQSLNIKKSKRSWERFLAGLPFLQVTTAPRELRDEGGRPTRSKVVGQLINEAQQSRRPVYFLAIHHLDDLSIAVTSTTKGRKAWLCFFKNSIISDNYAVILDKIAEKDALIIPSGDAVSWLREAQRKLQAKPSAMQSQSPSPSWFDALTGFHEQPRGSVESSSARHASLTKTISIIESQSAEASSTDTSEEPMNSTDTTNPSSKSQLSHLHRLEAESIHILREVMAHAENPVMLYSIGKDSSVMLHLARKAFYPSTPPFPLLHVDTRWKFSAMYEFREQMAQESGMELLVHINPEGVAKNINPFDHGSALHTDIMKTEGLKQALDAHGFDVAFGGARRDEEKSRAKERIFSFRNESHRWDPKNQRPELWNLYNCRKNPGESIRVFPLSNWTELDIWQYIYREHIPIVPLYFAAERPVIERNGMLIMVDDDRMQLLPRERIQPRTVRFRTLGCYPLTGAIDSNATDVADIVLELLQSTTSERQGRAIDTDSSGSMEKKKQEGYF